MKFKKQYQIFMREFIDKKWLQDYKNVKVLAENFICKKYYMVIFEADNEDNETTVYILIENYKNVKKPIKIHSYINPYGYRITSKDELIGKIPACIYSKLIENGLFEHKERAYGNKKARGTFGVHRLVLSLYDECLRHKVHHINLKRAFNPICNLVKLIKPMHDNTHKIYKKASFIDGVIASLKEQNKLKKILNNLGNYSYKETKENIIKVLNWRIKDERKTD